MATIKDMSILVVDDDQAVRDSLRRALTVQGYDVELAADGEEALFKLRTHPSGTDLLVVDVLMPRLDGLELTRRLRAEGSEVPILMLTARDQVADRVAGLEAGADDYLVKPFALEELIARVRALLRRAYPVEEQKQLSFPPFEIDIQRSEVRKNGAKIDLTPKEFELTVTLFRNMGRLLSRGHLQETVWGRSADLATRTVDTHVSQVRKKLDLKPESGYRVVPVYNYGYRLERLDAPAAQ